MSLFCVSRSEKRPWRFSHLSSLQVHQAYQRQGVLFNYLMSCHELWEQADMLVAKGNHTGKQSFDLNEFFQTFVVFFCRQIFLSSWIMKTDQSRFTPASIMSWNMFRRASRDYGTTSTCRELIASQSSSLILPSSSSRAKQQVKVPYRRHQAGIQSVYWEESFKNVTRCSTTRSFLMKESISFFTCAEIFFLSASKCWQNCVKKKFFYFVWNPRDFLCFRPTRY